MQVLWMCCCGELWATVGHCLVNPSSRRSTRILHAWSHLHPPLQVLCSMIRPLVTQAWCAGLHMQLAEALCYSCEAAMPVFSPGQLTLDLNRHSSCTGCRCAMYLRSHMLQLPSGSQILSGQSMRTWQAALILRLDAGSRLLHHQTVGAPGWSVRHVQVFSSHI
jgi:hypothetical protein